MKFYVYVIRSVESGRFYTGLTSDFDRRLKEHNSGKTKSTRPYRPWILVFIEEFDDRSLVRKREKYLKSGIGREFIKDYWTRSLTE